MIQQLIDVQISLAQLALDNLKKLQNNNPMKWYILGRIEGSITNIEFQINESKISQQTKTQESQS